MSAFGYSSNLEPKTAILGVPRGLDEKAFIARLLTAAEPNAAQLKSVSVCLFGAWCANDVPTFLAPRSGRYYFTEDNHDWSMFRDGFVESAKLLRAE